jgi:hypothetical protein
VTVSDFESSDFQAGDSIKPEREGLPSGYRMRADAHYVELLSSTPRTDRPRVEPTRVREDHTQVRAARDRRVLEHLSGDVAAIEAAAAMLSAEATPLARRVSLDLIKAQSARASWLLRAQALLGGHEADRAPRSRVMGDVLAGVRDRLAAECRLNGIGLQVTCESRAAVTIDDTLLALGVTGAVLSLAGLLTGLEGAFISVEALVEVDGDEDDLQSIEVSQDTVAVPASLKQRFFDADWVERPGGWFGAIGAAAAEATAVQLGGGVNLSTGSRRGCTLRFEFA